MQRNKVASGQYVADPEETMKRKVKNKKRPAKLSCVTAKVRGGE